jgi:maltose-binding protein MalE
MKKRFLMMAMVLLVAAGMFAAGEPEAEPEAMMEEPTETLTLWVYDEGRIEVLTEIGNQFEADYGVAVEVALVDLGDIRTQMLLTAGGEEAADLAIIPHDNLGALVVNDAVAPIDLGAKESQYLGPAIEAFSYNGELYGLPLAVENIGLFRNTDMVPDAPKTWDEMYAIGKALIDSGEADVIMSCPDATYNIFPVYTSYGGYIFGKDMSGALDPGDIGLASAGFIQGLQMITDWVEEGLVPDTIDWDGAHVLFETGRAPFIMTGPWALNRFVAEGVPYAISAFPSGGAPFLGVQGVVVSSVSDNLLLAQTFLTEYLATEDSMQAIFDAEQRPSAWKTVFEGANDPNVAGFNEAGVAAVPMPSIPEMGYVWDAWVNAAALAFSFELTPAEALANAVNQIETQIAEAE